MPVVNAKKRQGRNFRPCLKTATKGAVQSMRANLSSHCFGMKWNKPALRGARKLLKRWWPETGSNRRRQPFQGCLPIALNGSESMEVSGGESVTRNVG